jgi:hypothetical protein
MRVERMEGGLLDLWVALAMGLRRSKANPEPDEYGHYWMRMGIGASGFACPRFTLASRDSLAVIHRFRTSLKFDREAKLWESDCRIDGIVMTGVGETAAIAVCRAVVLAHFGKDPQLDTSDEPTDYDPELNGPRAYSAAH